MAMQIRWDNAGDLAKALKSLRILKHGMRLTPLKWVILSGLGKTRFASAWRSRRNFIWICNAKDDYRMPFHYASTFGSSLHSGGELRKSSRTILKGSVAISYLCKSGDCRVAYATRSSQ